MKWNWRRKTKTTEKSKKKNNFENYFSTDWCHRIASEPSPLTKRCASEMVNAVFSASNSNFVFSAMAVLNSFWIESKRDSISWKIARHLFRITLMKFFKKWSYQNFAIEKIQFVLSCFQFVLCIDQSSLLRFNYQKYIVKVVNINDPCT